MKGIASLLSGSALIFACRLAGAGLTFSTQALLAHWMGAKELGIYVLAFSWLILLSTASTLDYPTAALRFIGQYTALGQHGKVRGFIQHSRRVVLSISTALASLIIATILLLGDSLGITPDYAHTWIAAMLCLPVYTLFHLHDRIAQAHTWFGLAVAPTTVLRPLLFLLIIYLLSRNSETLAAATSMRWHLLAFLIAMSGQFLILRLRLKRTLTSAPIDYEKRLWLKTAAPLLIITLFSQYTADINIIIAGFFLDPEAIARYSISFRVALLIGFGIFAVHSVLMPRIAHLHAERNTAGMQRLVSQATVLTSVCSLIAVTLLLMFGKQILALFGDAFIGGYEPLLILALSQLVVAMAGPVSALLSMTGQQTRCLRVFGWALIVTVLLNLALIPRFGLNGAATAVLLSTIFWTAWLHKIVSSHLKIHSSLFALLPPRRKQQAIRPVLQLKQQVNRRGQESLLLKLTTVLAVTSLTATTFPVVHTARMEIALILAVLLWLLDGFWVHYHYQRFPARLGINKSPSWLQFCFCHSLALFHGAVIAGTTFLLIAAAYPTLLQAKWLLFHQ